ncbi:hypothetical protein [Edaphobacter dinghuensis]|uniref:Uncharacterized protein n=1 Tax=Edaphobacter dinghuensis TaxID=1560005 RepID=A0A917HG43_9BACT|nr:hypothetical protein [Edaphobacter dinghuensis]GGG77010.1 hypothetical protein GCM10011585_20020 [Edaphobacter dinghuensis]
MSAQKVPDADSHISPDAVSFLHVVIYAGIFLVIGLIAAFVIIKGVGKHMVPGKHDPHPTSQFLLPAAKRPALAALNLTESAFTFPQQNLRTRV